VNRDDLCARQEPLKQRYRDNPETGDLDFRGTLAVSTDVPVGFREIRVRFMLDTSATPEQLDTLLKLTERYCVVYQTLKQSPALSAKWETA
jgi:uncharacterized OsmC-like protein